MRMHGYRELLEKEVIEAWRTYRLALTCALFVVVGIAAPVITRYLPGLTGGLGPSEGELGIPEAGVPDVIALLLRNLVLFGGIAGLLLAMGSVAGERERGTLGLVLARPIGRGAFLWAKLVAIALVLGAGVALAVLAAWLYSVLLFGAVPVQSWISMALIAWLSTMVVASVTFAGSAVTGSTLGAAAVGLGGLAILGLASAVGSLNPWLPSGLLDVALAAGLEEVSPDLDPGRTIVVSLGVIVVSFAVAWLRFREAEA
jgi:ABC-type transport system involved in multi-copper enzyme maturation permease subunit